MDTYELIFNFIYFALFISANGWLFYVLVISSYKIFTNKLEIDILGRIISIAAMVACGMSILTSFPTFILLIFKYDIWYYELLTQFAFLGVFASVLSNILLARFKWSENYVVEQEQYSVLRHLDTIDILSLSISFIFAGSCAFFYCKKSH